MLTLGIVAILVGLAVPSVQRGISTQELNDATIETMHLIDYARIQAQSRNRAYELRISGVGGGNGTLTVNESANTRCDGFAAGLAGVRTVDLTNSPDFDAVMITAAFPSDLQAGTIGLCFKPDGRVLQTDTGRPVSPTDSTYGAGEAWIDLRRITNDGNPIGDAHRIVIPYNGVPRREFP